MNEDHSPVDTIVGNPPTKYPRGLKIALVAVAVVICLGVAGVVAIRSVWRMYFIPSMGMAPTLTLNDRLSANLLAYHNGEPKHGDVVVFRAPLAATPDATKEKDFIKRVIGLPGDRIRITGGHVLVGGVNYSHRDIAAALHVTGDADSDRWVMLAPDGARVGGKIVTKAQIASAVGNPGAQVKIVPGVVYRNGKALIEPYVAEDCDGDYPMPNTPTECVKTEGGKRVVLIPKGRLLVMGDNRNDSYDSRFWGLLERNRLIGQATAIVFPQDRAGAIK